MDRSGFSRSLLHLTSLAFKYIVPWLLALAVLAALRDAALALSGQNTLFGAWVEFTSNIRVSRGFAFVFGTLGILYGLQQRSHRRAEEQRLTQRIRQLEHRLEAGEP